MIIFIITQSSVHSMTLILFCIYIKLNNKMVTWWLKACGCDSPLWLPKSCCFHEPSNSKVHCDIHRPRFCDSVIYHRSLSGYYSHIITLIKCSFLPHFNYDTRLNYFKSVVLSSYMLFIIPFLYNSVDRLYWHILRNPESHSVKQGQRVRLRPL